MRKYLVSFYVNDDVDSIEFYSDYRRGSKANRADAMAEIRRRKGDYIANRAEIYAIACDLADQLAGGKLFDYDNIKSQLIDYCGDYVEDFDVPAIMGELYYSGIEYSIDQLSYDGFVEILKRHDLSENWQ